MPRWLTLGAISLIVAAGGCARLPAPPLACRIGTTWSTTYASSQTLATLGPDQIRVLSYHVVARPSTGRRCGTVTLVKSLTVLRGPGALHIIELRHFYTRGRLVAVHRSRIGHELTLSGHYRARVTLPVPASAPLGSYRVVSDLYARWGTATPTLIAQTTTHFTIRR